MCWLGPLAARSVIRQIVQRVFLLFWYVRICPQRICHLHHLHLICSCPHAGVGFRQVPQVALNYRVMNGSRAIVYVICALYACKHEMLSLWSWMN